MKMEFKVEIEVPDPITMNVDVLTIGSERYCAFTGLPTGVCECGYWKPEGRYASAGHFADYVLKARGNPNSLFAIVANQLKAQANASERAAEQADYEHWAGEFGRARTSDYLDDFDQSAQWDAYLEK
jgi:hypothetical protein